MRRSFSLRSRSVLIGWVAPAVGLLVLVLIVWLAGGFRPAERVAGPSADLGERLDLRRWSVVVHQVALVDTGTDGVLEQDPAFRVWATLTHTGASSELMPDLIAVRVLGGGPEPGGWQTRGERPRQWYDPDVARDIVLDYPWPDRDDPAWLPAPDRIAVVVNDEVQSRNYLYGMQWEVAAPAGVIIVEPEDRRQRS